MDATHYSRGRIVADIGNYRAGFEESDDREHQPQEGSDHHQDHAGHAASTTAASEGTAQGST